jgi:hypothetical protein
MPPPAGPAELLATLSRPLAPPELLLIGWTPAEPDLTVVIAHDLDGTEADDELTACRQLVIDGAEQVAVIVAFPAPYRDELPAPPTAELLARFAAACCSRYGLDLVEVIVVKGARWRSLACTDPTCCPPEGRPLPHLIKETPTP